MPGDGGDGGDGEARLARLVADAACSVDGSPAVGVLAVANDRLRCLATAELPASYREAVEAVAVRSDGPFWGRAAWVGAPVLVADAPEDPLFAHHRSLVDEAGMRACAAFPVVDGGGVGSMLCLYWRTAGKPSPAAMRTASALAEVLAVGLHQLGALQQLERKATEDPLTGLPNRNLLEDHLALAWGARRRRGAQLAVMFLDVDRLKWVNDSLGHAAGDRLIVAVGERLLSAVRPTDTVARIGGDEFAVVCPDVGTTGEAREIAERLLRAVSQPLKLESHDIRPSASLGVALSVPGTPDVEALLRGADHAMYQAKQEGAGRYIFATGSDYQSEMLASLVTAAELAHAVDDGQMCVHFQPIVRADSGRVVALEALARWNHPKRGLLHPAAFLPAAEESDQIRHVGAWVLREAARQAAELRDTTPAWRSVRIAVNVSPRQLSAADFVETITSAASAADLPVDALCLEVTEAAIIRNERAARNVLVELRDMGAEVALDDFGTGASSLTHLFSLPVDHVKLDRSFVAGLPVDSRSEAITGAVARIARSIDAHVTAEGVERPEQFDGARRNGCTMFQGYLVAAPQPIAEVVQALNGAPLWDLSRRQQPGT